MKAEWISIGENSFDGKYTAAMNTAAGVVVKTYSTNGVGTDFMLKIPGEHYNKETGEFELIGNNSHIDKSCENCKYGDIGCTDQCKTIQHENWEPKK